MDLQHFISTGFRTPDLATIVSSYTDYAISANNTNEVKKKRQQIKERGSKEIIQKEQTRQKQIQIDGLHSLPG
jgi:adenylate kinase family enzyme